MWAEGQESGGHVSAPHLLCVPYFGGINDGNAEPSPKASWGAGRHQAGTATRFWGARLLLEVLSRLLL